MNKSNADIELIRKYYNGELSPASRHELEKKALDDPFLQDAMDGFEQFSIDQKTFDVLDNQLANRLQKKEKVVVIWGFKQWSIAASLIFGIAAISIYFNQTPENKVIAVSELQKKERLPKSIKILEDTLGNDANNAFEENVNAALSDVSKTEEATPFSIAEELALLSTAQTNTLVANDTLALNEVSVIGYETQNKKDVFGSTSRFKAEEVAKVNIESASAAKVSLMAGKSRNQNVEQIVGKVISLKEGKALPNVQITNTINGSVAISNDKGEFKILANENDQLTAKYIGYLTETFTLNKAESLKISLKEDNRSLSEGVVIGNEGKKSIQEVAGPKGGWREFRKYLDENAKLSTGETGRVVVQFYIQPDGKLSDFLIQKSYNTLANNKAIQLIKDYKVWYGSANGKAQKAKATVRFK